MAKTSTLVDDFAAGIGSAWVTGGVVTAVSGAVQLEHDATYYSFAFIESVATYDFTESSFYFQIAYFGAYTDTVTGIKLFIGPSIDDGNSELIRVSAGALAGGGLTAGVWTPASGVPVALDQVAHAWWRMRHASAVVYWDTSPDGVTWTNQGSKAAEAWDHTAVKIRILCDLDALSGSADTIRIDNVNTAGVAPAVGAGFFQFF